MNHLFKVLVCSILMLNSMPVFAMHSNPSNNSSSAANSAPAALPSTESAAPASVVNTLASDVRSSDAAANEPSSSKSKIVQEDTKIALVTGASNGIGKAVAMHLAEKWYHVVLIARDADKLKSVFEEITRNGESAEICPLDVSDAEEVALTINAIITRYGRIDLLFNNAGISKRGTTEMTDQDLDELLKINLNGAIYMAKNVATQMKKQRSGYIINVSSICGKVATSFAGVYCASKFGLAGYSEALTKDMALYDVKVTNLCPSMVATDMVTKDRDFPPDKMLQVSDIVKTLDYLLSLSANALPTEIVISCMPLVAKVAQLTKQAYGLR